MFPLYFGSHDESNFKGMFFYGIWYCFIQKVCVKICMIGLSGGTGEGLCLDAPVCIHAFLFAG